MNNSLHSSQLACSVPARTGFVGRSLSQVVLPNSIQCSSWVGILRPSDAVAVAARRESFIARSSQNARHISEVLPAGRPASNASHKSTASKVEAPAAAVHVSS